MGGGSMNASSLLKFLIKNGFCEDSINIIKSKGSVDEILIYNPLKDGVDLDFSNIKIKNIVKYFFFSKLIFKFSIKKADIIITGNI